MSPLPHYVSCLYTFPLVSTRVLGQVCVPPVCVCACVYVYVCMCPLYAITRLLMYLCAPFTRSSFSFVLQCTCDYESCAYVCVSKPPGVVCVYECVYVCAHEMFMRMCAHVCMCVSIRHTEHQIRAARRQRQAQPGGACSPCSCS